MSSPLQKQVAGNHYKSLRIQPVEFIHANSIGYFEGNVIKYVTRWKEKNGVTDLEKAKHYIELLIDLHNKEVESIKRELAFCEELGNLQLQDGFPHNPLSSFPSIFSPKSTP